LLYCLSQLSGGQCFPRQFHATIPDTYAFLARLAIIIIMRRIIIIIQIRSSNLQFETLSQRFNFKFGFIAAIFSQCVKYFFNFKLHNYAELAEIQAKNRSKGRIE